MLFSPAHIHAEQHLGPILGFGAAGASMHFQEAIVCVRFARKQAFEFAFRGAFAQGFKGGLGFLDDGRVAFRLAQLDQFDLVGQFAFDFPAGLDLGLQTRAFLKDALGLFGLVPKGRVLGLAGQLVEPFEGVLPVKDASLAALTTAGFLSLAFRFRHA